MRKILAIVLAIVLMLSLCAGCKKTSITYDDDIDDEPITIAIGGISDDDVDDDKDDLDDDTEDDFEDDADDESDDDSIVDDDQPDDGPAVEWPSVLPPYEKYLLFEEELKISIELREDGTYIITITDTYDSNVSTYKSFVSGRYHWKLINFRYLRSDPPVPMRYRKDAHHVVFEIFDTEIRDKVDLVITLQPWHEEEELPNVWPADRLPQGFPEYTNGKISYVRAYTIEFQTETDLSISIDGSSKGAVEKYATALKDAGWKVEHIGNERFLSYSEDQQNGDSWTFEKDGVYGIVEFHKLAGGTYIQIIDKKFIN